MKKVISLCVVFFISAISMTAQQDMQARMKERVDNYVKELKLDDKKAEEFRKVQNDHMEKMQKEMQAARESGNQDREAMREKMTKMNSERDEAIKKVLSDDEYKKYQEILSKEPRRGPGGGGGRPPQNR